MHVLLTMEMLLITLLSLRTILSNVYVDSELNVKEMPFLSDEIFTTYRGRTKKFKTLLRNDLK